MEFLFRELRGYNQIKRTDLLFADASTLFGMPELHFLKGKNTNSNNSNSCHSKPLYGPFFNGKK